MNVHIEIYLLIIYHCSIIFECVNVYHHLERGENKEIFIIHILLSLIGWLIFQKATPN